MLDGIRIAFNTLNNEYCRISKSDFLNSDDSKPIKIFVELEENEIPTLNYLDSNGQQKCGFQVIIKRSQRGRYVTAITRTEKNVYTTIGKGAISK